MKNIKKWITDRYIYKWFSDVINFFRFIYQTKHIFKKDRTFIDLGFNVNSIGNIVYVQINCTDEELQAANYSPIDMVLKKAEPHADYLDKRGWSEYLIPQITNFTDENDNMTLSYLVLFIFWPFVFSFKKLLYFIFSIIGLTGVGFLIKWFIETYM